MTNSNLVKMETSSEGLCDLLAYILAIVNEHQRFMEAKNLVVVGLCGGGFYTVMNIFISNEVIARSEWLLFLYQLLAGTILAAFISLLSLFPRMKNNSRITCSNRRPQEINYLFFGHIALLDEESFVEKLKEVADIREKTTSFHLQYANQIIVNSRIAAYKACMFKAALIVLIFSLNPIPLFLSC